MWRLYSNSRQSVRPFIRLSVRPFSFVYPSIWNRIRATHHWNSGHLSLLALYSLSLLRVVGCCSLVVIVDWISRFEYKFLFHRGVIKKSRSFTKNFSQWSKFLFFFFFPLLIQCDRAAFKKLALLKNIFNLNSFELAWNAACQASIQFFDSKEIRIKKRFKLNRKIYFI